MQVLPSALQPVMDRLFLLATTRTRQALLSANQVEVDFPLLRFEADVLHLPRRLQSQSNGKQIGRFHSCFLRHQDFSAVKLR